MTSLGIWRASPRQRTFLEAIAGVFKSVLAGDQPYATERDDGLGSSRVPCLSTEIADKIGIALPEQCGFEMVAGFVLARLQHVPQTGEWIETNGWRFEVVDRWAMHRQGAGEPQHRTASSRLSFAELRARSFDLLEQQVEVAEVCTEEEVHGRTR